MFAFDYHRPASVDAAAELLRTLDEPVLVAGGQTLIPTLKQRLAHPSDVVDLGGIASLRGIRDDGGRLAIGAMTPHATVATSAAVRGRLPALARLAGGIGDPQVRNRGTLGGSVANSDPAADYPAAVVALGATVRTNRRSIDGEAFFRGMFETALDAGEILVGIDFPLPDRAAYCKFANPASRYAVVGVFVALFGARVSVGVTGAGPCAFRAKAFEDALAADLAPGALDGIDVPSGEFNADLHASADYRAHLVTVMAKRAVAALPVS
jgi:carbon-monoxide dehydrogenase medium subunit